MAFSVLGVEAVFNQNLIKGNGTNFTRRSWRVVQVLYQRGLLKEGLAHLPKALLGITFGKGSRKPAVITQADLFRPERADVHFKAAAELGLKSILAPGLPGKTAPVSAGRTLAAVYLCLLIKNGKGGAEVET
jgi:hypothetical protein